MAADFTRVMRSVYLPTELDDKLRRLAYIKKMSKNELILKILQKSLEWVDVDDVFTEILEARSKKEKSRR